MTITEVIALGIGLAAALATWAGLVLYRRAGRDGGDPRTGARRRLTALSVVAAGVSALAAVVLAAGLHGTHDSSAAGQVARSYTQASADGDGASAATGGTLAAPSTSPSSGTSSSGFGSGGS